MDKCRKKKPDRTDAKSKKRKNVKNDDASILDRNSISCDGNANDVSVVSTSFGGVSKTLKESEFCSDTGALPSSSSETPSTPIPRSCISTLKGEETPCSSYKVTKDDDGKPSKVDKSRKKKPARTDAKSKKGKNVKNDDDSISCDGSANDVSVVSTSFGGVSKTLKESKVCSDTGALPSSSSKTPSTPIPRSCISTLKVEETPCSSYKVTKDDDGKPSKVDKSRKKKSVRTDAKIQKRKNSKTEDNNVMVSTSFGGDSNTPKESKVKSGTGTMPSSSSKTPSTPIPRSFTSSLKGENTPCSFYKVTEDEDGKPVFSKSLIKYFLTVDSPEMDDLKNKRWNTSFLHETPKPNREIKIFTEDEDNDPKYLENVPDIDSNLPDVPGSLHADIFKRMPIYDSDEELKTLFQEITPVKGPKGRRKRKSTRISCYNGKPLADEFLSFNYSGLLNTDISFDEDRSESKENIMDIKIEEA